MAVGGSIPSLPTNIIIIIMKAYHVYSANCSGEINYFTCSKEKAMKDQCVFVRIDEIEIQDIPSNVEQHNQLLNEVLALFNPVFAIEPKVENLVEIITKFKEGFQGLEALKK